MHDLNLHLRVRECEDDIDPSRAASLDLDDSRSFLFFNVFRRMRSVKAPGRFKPLGFALAIILFLLIRISPMAMGIEGLDHGYGLVVISFAGFWTSLTGRMDRIVGTI